MQEKDFIEVRRKKTLKKLPSLEEASADPAKYRIKRGNAFQYTKTGFRSDLGIVARSNWEANIIRILEVHRIKWEFEPKTFTYPVKRGVKGYIPDIYLPDTNEYIEVKGWLDNRSRTKLKRFKKYYPNEFSNMTIIIGRSDKAALATCQEIGIPTILFYHNFMDLYKPQIKNWEGTS